MGDMRLIVDHLKLDYKGPFQFNQLVRLINSFLNERGYDAKYDKDFEINTKTGKHIDWQIMPWKKISDYAKYWAKVRILVQDMNKVEIVKDDKKEKVDNARIIITFDGYLELDYFHYWDEHPFFVFIRSLYDRFIYKAYTDRFEKRLSYDIHQLYDRVERFLNFYRHYRVVTRVPHFSHL